ncbi:unnamed protein product [Gadus morhua 'NCC']
MLLEPLINQLINQLIIQLSADDMNCIYRTPLLTSALPPLLGAEFVLGVLGNGLALWIILFRLKPWKSSTVLLFNLSLADFLLNVALPFRASYYSAGLTWHFGPAFCNISLFLLAMNRSGSIFFLTAVAVDRYVRVVHPHHALNSLSVVRAACGAAGLWLLTFSMTAHLLALPRPNATDCESFHINSGGLDVVHFWHRSLFLLSFFLPLALIVFCTCSIVAHLRRRQLARDARIRKALWLLMVVVVVFAVCFLPSNITQLLIWLKEGSIAGVHSGTKACDEMENLNTAFYLTISLTYLNSALDPVVFYFSIPPFRNMCRRALRLGRAGDTGDEETTQ